MIKFVIYDLRHKIFVYDDWKERSYDNQFWIIDQDIYMNFYHFIILLEKTLFAWNYTYFITTFLVCINNK